MQHLGKINISQEHQLHMELEDRIKELSISSYSNTLDMYKSIENLTPRMFEEIEQEVFIQELFSSDKIAEFVDYAYEPLKKAIKEGLNETNRTYMNNEESIFEDDLHRWYFDSKVYDHVLPKLVALSIQEESADDLADEIAGYYHMYTVNESYNRYQLLFKEI